MSLSLPEVLSRLDIEEHKLANKNRAHGTPHWSSLIHRQDLITFDFFPRVFRFTTMPIIYLQCVQQTTVTVTLAPQWFIFIDVLGLKRTKGRDIRETNAMEWIGTTGTSINLNNAKLCWSAKHFWAGKNYILHFSGENISCWSARQYRIMIILNTFCEWLLWPFRVMYPLPFRIFETTVGGPQILWYILNLNSSIWFTFILRPEL